MLSLFNSVYIVPTMCHALYLILITTLYGRYDYYPPPHCFQMWKLRYGETK